MVSPVESKVLAIAPKFTAFLSICGSLGIVLKVLLNASRRKNTMHRIMAGMSVCDILASIWYFAGTWAIPNQTISWFGDGDTETIFWAAGDENGTSCSFAGFFNQFAVATPMYNTTLAGYFLLVVYYGWSDARVAKIEWLLHTIPLGYALITSIFAVAADLYGHVEWTCWIISDETQELTPIQSNFKLIQWIFLFAVVWACIIFETITFVVLYRKMRSLERVMTRYTFGSSFNNRSEHSTSPSIRESISKLSYSDSGFSVHKMSENGPLEEGKERSSTEKAPRSDIEEDINLVVSVNDEDTGQDLNYKANEGISQETSSTQGYITEHINVKEVIAKEGVEEEEQNGSINATCTINIEPSVTPPQENKYRKGFPTTSLISVPSVERADQNSGNRDASNLRHRRVRRESAKSRKIAIQGLYYVGAFYITWLFPTITRITELVWAEKYFLIQLLDTFFLPLQGFLNFLIYVRPTFMSHRKNCPEDGFWKSLKIVVFENRV